MFQINFVLKNFKWKIYYFKNVDSFKSQNYWNPKIKIDNALGECKTELTYNVDFQNDVYVINETRKIKGTFIETLGINK